MPICKNCNRWFKPEYDLKELLIQSLLSAKRSGATARKEALRWLDCPYCKSTDYYYFIDWFGPKIHVITGLVWMAAFALLSLFLYHYFLIRNPNRNGLETALVFFPMLFGVIVGSLNVIYGRRFLKAKEATLKWKAKMEAEKRTQDYTYQATPLLSFDAWLEEAERRSNEERKW